MNENYTHWVCFPVFISLAHHTLLGISSFIDIVAMSDVSVVFYRNSSFLNRNSFLKLIIPNTPLTILL